MSLLAHIFKVCKRSGGLHKTWNCPIPVPVNMIIPSQHATSNLFVSIHPETICSSTSGRNLLNGVKFALAASRSYSSSAIDYEREVEDINNMFVEARDEIEYALEDSDTVYFNESVDEAKRSVDKCLEKWRALVESLPEAEAQRLQRSMGLKMEQLKAEFEELRKTHLEE
ncbi:hypothetical protein CEUSTIGMA_g5767.t1 [Chlamydomonas eustigma]|uniref:Uncharacterized protein n=1 Tax=Chlamydomonas eustigma TaxID=1157962 RepID=A0A250X5G8_9CHLO|nr:hypothetical protein CEUSTIGMA_g5767.t1 [Chlamydomonas eustigma]|eukprot:GAX78325.1 hypothetical protein CEUSTIGMA_g5767.t1 [Chlamydomonas eustigma]